MNAQTLNHAEELFQIAERRCRSACLGSDHDVVDSLDERKNLVKSAFDSEIKGRILKKNFSTIIIIIHVVSIMIIIVV